MLKFDEMKNGKKIAILLIILSLLFAGILMVTSQRFMWGYEVLEGGDEIRHFSRGRAIGEQRVDIFHRPQEPNDPEFYPPGIHILYANMFMISGTTNAFSLSLIFKLMVFSTIFLMYFLIGNKISATLGVGAMFFRIFLFSVSSIITTNRILLETLNLTISGTLFSEFCMLFYFAYIVYIFKNNLINSKIFGLSTIFLLTAMVHGLTHISDFIMFLIGVIMFILFYSIIYLGTLGRRFFRLNLSYPKKSFGLIFSLSMLSASVTYLSYYFRILNEANMKGYDFSRRLPDIISTQRFFTVSNLLSPILLIISLALVIYFFKSKNVRLGCKISCLRINKLAFLFPIIFLALYMLEVYYVNLSPYSYIRTGAVTRIAGFYPRYLDFTTTLNVMSIMSGFILLFLSVVGLYYLLSQRKEESILISILFFVLFLGSTFNNLPWFFFTHDIGAYLMRLSIPFLLGGSLLSIMSIKNSNAISFLDIMNNLIAKKKKLLVILIIIFMMSVSTVRNVNYQPPVRDEYDKNHFMRFGTTSDMSATPELIKAVQTFTENGERVLASRYTYEVLTVTTHIGHIETKYGSYKTNNQNWSIFANAWRNGNLENYFDHYGGSFIVFSLRDINNGNHFLNEEQIIDFQKNPRLIKVYENSHGESIYEFHG